MKRISLLSFIAAAPLIGLVLLPPRVSARDSRRPHYLSERAHIQSAADGGQQFAFQNVHRTSSRSRQRRYRRNGHRAFHRSLKRAHRNFHSNRSDFRGGSRGARRTARRFDNWSTQYPRSYSSPFYFDQGWWYRGWYR